MLPPFLISDFSKETLSNLVRVRFGNEFPDIIKKRQVDYIFRYLEALSAKSILLEMDYIDRDYLEDYSRYYVGCFQRYGERCARLHFFSGDLSHEKIKKALSCSGEELSELKVEMKDGYLGFMVVKPIPKAFIGKTCLKIYNSIREDHDKKILSKIYEVNLFGIELQVETIAFQEQDKIVSACATTAIWSLLHAQESWGNVVPSSSEITLSAINHIENSVNSFPNSGLTNKQIFRALDIYGLRNHKVKLDDEFNPEVFESLVKSYVDSEMPILLGGDIYTRSKMNGIDYGDWVKVGSHAVTILGYHQDQDLQIYVHDDQFGPFAKARMSSEKIKGVARQAILLRHKHNKDWSESEQLILPTAMIIPTQPKIRIPFDIIRNTCEIISDNINVMFESGLLSEKSVFNIRLMSLKEFRAKVIGGVGYENKYSVLTRNLARYIWVADFFEGQSDEVLFTIAFDATDIPNGKSILEVVVANEDFFECIKSEVFSKDQISMDYSSKEISKHFYFAFVRFVWKSLDSRSLYLDNMYGELRAPNKIKATEVQNDEIIETPKKEFHGCSGERLDYLYEEKPSLENPLIWAVSGNGSLLIGQELNGRGHPSLTGFDSARIAGELFFEDGFWYINSKSGRYSKQYSNAEAEVLLNNARKRFREVFPDDEVKCKCYGDA